MRTTFHQVTRHCRRAWLAVAMAIYSAGGYAAGSAADAKPPAGAVEPLGASGFGQMLLGLVAVLALIVGLAWLMRRLGGIPGMSGGSLRVLGGLSMGTRERVVLIQVGETQLLLGVAPGRVQTLHVLDHPVELDDKNHPGQGAFAASLNAALRRSKTS